MATALHRKATRNSRLIGYGFLCWLINGCVRWSGRTWLASAFSKDSLGDQAAALCVLAVTACASEISFTAGRRVTHFRTCAGQVKFAQCQESVPERETPPATATIAVGFQFSHPGNQTALRFRKSTNHQMPPHGHGANTAAIHPADRFRADTRILQPVQHPFRCKCQSVAD